MSESVLITSDEEIQAMRILDNAGASEDTKECIRILMRQLYAKVLAAEYLRDVNLLERFPALLSSIKPSDSVTGPDIVVKDEFWELYNCKPGREL